ncbi:MAG: RagB/SusD family nutrient uptake outer membrane protein [Gemmatimonadaceae bacterium]|nr:RagB/SusD family nutrient uptake outer membrane protein [Gemmatimonadaceae bacterium]
MTRSIRVTGLSAILLLAPALGFLEGCTDLTEVPTSSIAPENFYRNQEEVIGGLASVYAQMRATTDGYYNLTEVSSDEYIVPTRGTDWYDNGRWLEIDRQLWGANSPSGLDDVNGTWNGLFTGVARANVALAAVDKVSFPDKAIVQAELRTLRAFYYFLLQDLFGGVPVVSDTEIMPRAQNTRAEVFAFIEKELNETRAVLPASWPAEMNGRMTKGAADAILASLYLNAQVFTGTVTAAGLQPGPAKWQEAVTASDRILNSGVYSLASDWRSNFTASNHLSPEIIMSVKYLNETDLGLNFLMRALHYTQFTPSPWNGFATIAETYFAFDADDKRRQIFLEGRQFNLETGAPVNDRTGKPLIFDPNIGDVTNASEGAGVRIAKWPVDPNHVQQNNGNDFAHFRLAEIMLIKAEALNELGQTAAAIALVNTVRARVFSPAEPISAGISQAAFRDVILKERLFELTAEGKRRQDLIRHNKFTQRAWFNKAVREPYRILMPIPQTQIETNPLLVQNAGY